MGDVVHINFKPTQPTFSERRGTAVASSDFVDGPSRRTFNSALYNVGFDDSLKWRIPKPFRHEHVRQGLIAAPDIIAIADDGRVRLVKMFEGERPPQLDARTIITANLDCWVLSARQVRETQWPELWVVFDDGSRFELQPAPLFAQAHAELAMREMRAEGLYELSTSEAATLVIPC